VIGSPHGVLIVLYHHKGVSSVTEVAEDAKKLLVVPRVESDGGLIEDIEHALEVGAELGGQTDSLGFPP
jgi:hypothetical protein